MTDDKSFGDELVELARSEAPSYSAPIGAYITNLGKYVEGALVGRWHDFPTTKEKLQETLKEIGIDGIRYEELFITDYETSVDGLYGHLGEYENLDELNYFAELLDGMDEYDMQKFEAAIEFGEYTGSVKDLINLSQNLDNYAVYPDITSEEEYGYYIIDECCALEIPDSIRPYFDYESFGRDCSLDESSMFTDKGYARDTGDSFTEYYSGRDDIPDESHVFAYPKLDIPDKAHRQPKKEEHDLGR